LVIVKPETFVYWQRKCFKKYWRKISDKNRKPGRKLIKKEIRDLKEQKTW